MHAGDQKNVTHYTFASGARACVQITSAVRLLALAPDSLRPHSDGAHAPRPASGRTHLDPRGSRGGARPWVAVANEACFF
ncbi:hypothetical protein T492DRAFT_936338 [Pavlovales sp. CCMP2436]|nr:hypothetical protein T492DRAFT_936338 [Pavlovales sp. CCMP2436]